MSVESLAQVSYRLRDRERLFSIGYSIYTNRQRVLHKGEKVCTFPQMLQRSLLYAGVLMAILVGYLVILMVKGVDILGVAMIFIGVIYLIALLRGWREQKRNYEYALQRFLDGGDEEGTLHFDEWGITDVSASGKESAFSWQDYRYCILVSDAIMFLFTNERDEILMLNRDVQTEEEICRILEGFDKQDTIRRLEMKGETK